MIVIHDIKHGDKWMVIAVNNLFLYYGTTNYMFDKVRGCQGVVYSRCSKSFTKFSIGDFSSGELLFVRMEETKTINISFVNDVAHR